MTNYSFSFCLSKDVFTSLLFIKGCFAGCNFSVDKVRLRVGLGLDHGIVFGLVFLGCEADPTLPRSLLSSQFGLLYLFFVAYHLEP